MKRNPGSEEFLLVARCLPCTKAGERVFRALKHMSESSTSRKIVVILDPEPEHSIELCSVLEKERYQTVLVSSPGALPESLKSNPCLALIIDLDRLVWDNRSLRGLREENRGLNIIGLSSRPFHPELKEALSGYIDACFSKPVEKEHLLYWLRGVCNNSEQPLPETVERNGVA
jgi:DNA-binding response OmpR family regulator